MNFVLLGGKINYVGECKTAQDSCYCVAVVACNKITNEKVLTDFVPIIAFGTCAVVLSKCKKGDYICARGYWYHTSTKVGNNYKNKDQCRIEYIEVLKEAPSNNSNQNKITDEYVDPYEGFTEAFPQMSMDEDIPY